MPNPSDYEERWSELRTDWAKEKISEWIQRLNETRSEVEAKKLRQDIANMARVLRDWEAESE